MMMQKQMAMIKVSTLVENAVMTARYSRFGSSVVSHICDSGKATKRQSDRISATKEISARNFFLKRRETYQLTANAENRYG